MARFTAEGLSDALTDADPQKDGKPRLPTSPLVPGAAKAAAIVNRFLDDLTDVLKAEPKANTALLRGFSKFPSIPTMQELFKLRPAAIANYPMYKGLAKLLGMTVMDVGSETSDLFDALEKNYNDHDFFYVHYKKTDSAGEDGKFEAKVAAIEALDKFIPRLAALDPDVLVVTSDHSTPALLKRPLLAPEPVPARVADGRDRRRRRVHGEGLRQGDPRPVPRALRHASHARPRAQAQEIRRLRWTMSGGSAEQFESRIESRK